LEHRNNFLERLAVVKPTSSNTLARAEVFGEEFKLFSEFLGLSHNRLLSGTKAVRQRRTRRK
jgi:hypothetical protein